jgi:putative hemolysin
MIGAIWIILIVLIFLSAWLSTIERAMMMTAPLVLRHELELRGTPQRGLWIDEQYEPTLQSISFAKIECFFGIMLGFVFLFDLSPTQLTTFAAGVAIALFVIWLTSSVIAGAIAQAVPISLITRSWYLIRFVSILNPVIAWWVEGIAEIARRLTGANLKKVNGSKTVEEQLLRSIEHSQLEGGIPAEAAEMMENVVDLNTTDVGEIMTPRTDIEGIELTNDLAEIRKFVIESGRSRIPIFDDNLDQILGILYVKDLIGYLGEDANGFELKSILRKPIVVPDTKSVQELLADFQTSEVHMAVVIDEYGGTAGLVTIEDVLEEIVGEIRDEHDDAESDEPELLRINENLVEVDGRYNLDDFNDELGVELPEDEEYDTIAGFILAQLGHVPLQGEIVEFHGMKMTAVEVSETQISRLSIEFSTTTE